MIRFLTPVVALPLLACSPGETPAAPEALDPAGSAPAAASPTAPADPAAPQAPAPRRRPAPTHGADGAARPSPSDLADPAPQGAPADPDRPVGPAVGPGKDLNGDGRITEDERPHY